MGNKAYMQAIGGSVPPLEPLSRRVYSNIPGNYLSYPGYLGYLGQLYLSYTYNRVGSERDAVARACGHEFFHTLKACMFPFWLVDEDFLKAVLNTRPPEVWDADTFKFPFPAMSFLLPKGVVKGDTGEDIVMVMISSNLRYAKIEAGKEVLQEGEYMLGSMGMSKDSNGHYSQWWDTRKLKESKVDLTAEVPLWIPEGTSKASVKDVSVGITSLCMQLVLLMNMLKEDKEMMEHPFSDPEGYVVKPRVKSGKSIWNAKWLGRNYASKAEYQPKGGTHASPEMHSRRGHYAMQPYGPKGSLRKQIWRPYTIVNPK